MFSYPFYSISVLKKCECPLFGTAQVEIGNAELEVVKDATREKRKVSYANAKMVGQAKYGDMPPRRRRAAARRDEGRYLLTLMNKDSNSHIVCDVGFPSLGWYSSSGVTADATAHLFCREFSFMCLAKNLGAAAVRKKMTCFLKRLFWLRKSSYMRVM